MAEKLSAEPLPSGGWLGYLRTRLRQRQDSEHEQAIIRIAFALLIGGYVVLVPAEGPGADLAFRAGIGICLISLVASIALLAQLLAYPAVSLGRRYVGALIDIVGLNAVMLVGGMRAAVFYPVLLWVILGHGFRFGQRQLAMAATMSLLLFGGVITLNANWRAVPALDVALTLALVVLPAYFAALLSKLRAAIQRAEEASQVKSRFLATMSHEFRTPLNAVIGMSELMRGTRLDHEQLDMIVTIRGAARNLLGLVNDLLDVAKLEAGGFVVENGPFDLFTKLATVRALLTHEAAERGLYLRLRVDPGTPWQLVGAMRLLHQIMVNLVANALRFTTDGGVEIAVRPLPVEPPDPQVWLRVEVSDTGIGIMEAARGRIFDRFEQADDATGRRFGGTGLGLAIVRQLVDLLGGRIGVASEPGSGSCFWMELPFDRQVQPPSATVPVGRVVLLGPAVATVALAGRLKGMGFEAVAVEEATRLGLQLAPPLGRAAIVLAGSPSLRDEETLADLLAWRAGAELVDVLSVGLDRRLRRIATLADLPVDAADTDLAACLRAALAQQDDEGAASAPRWAAASGRPARVLVAEDNQTNRKVIGRILERAGHHVMVVETGEAVLEAIEAESYDIVLMDINMPGMSGIEAMKLLRFIRPAHELPPVVVLSADATAETRRESEAAGFSGYLTKPVEAGLVLAMIDELVGARDGLAATPTVPEPAASGDRGGATILAHPALDSSRPVIDLAKLRNLEALDSGDGFLEDVIRDFLSDADQIMARIEAAVAAGRVREMRDQAHALRSSAAYLGATALFELCLGWREFGDDALAARGQTELVRLRRELSRLRGALADFQKNRAGPRPPSHSRA